MPPNAAPIILKEMAHRDSHAKPRFFRQTSGPSIIPGDLPMLILSLSSRPLWHWQIFDAQSYSDWFSYVNLNG